jgi:hypothetical protein
MALQIDQNFIRLFDAEVFTAYQRNGSMIRGFVREKSGNARDFRFPKYGIGALGTKGKHGLVPVMNADHSFVDVAVQDWYGGEYIDDLDEIKTNIDERGQAAGALAKAAGRKVDERIVNAVTGASLGAGQQIVHGSVSFTKAKVTQMVETFGQNDIPDDGNRAVLISPKGWTQGLLNIVEFTSQDYVGSDALPWITGITAKRWMGFTWMQFTGLTLATTTRTCLAMHKPAVGLAINSEIKSNFDWVPERAAHFAQVRVSCESVVIENRGCMQIQITES